MVSLPVFFWIFVFVTAVIGAMRGWAKEIMVTFSVTLGIFLIVVLETYVSVFRNLMANAAPSTVFWVQAIIIMILAFFGYQTPNIKGLAGPRFARERLADTLMGILVGAFNGYLIFGSLWYYMDAAGYPFPKYIQAPPPGSELAAQVEQMMKWMPPAYLVPPWIYCTCIWLGLVEADFRRLPGFCWSAATR